jgi:hypothetical protein
MAGKSRRKARKRNTRKRNALGHFTKPNPRKKAKRKPAAKRRSGRSAARRSTTKRARPARRAKRRAKTSARRAMRKTAPRKISKRLKRAATGRFQARRRHPVRGHLRKKRGGGRTRVAQHMSYEEMPNPRRRRRRSRAREEVQEMAQENPRRRRRGKKRKSARKAPVRRRARARARKNPVRRRRSVTVRAMTRRRSKGRTVSRPAKLRIELSDLRGRRRGPKRRKSSARRKSAKGRRKGGRRKSSRSRTPSSHQLMAAMENPLGFGYGMEEYALENPLSGGELTLAFVTGGLGMFAGNMLDRYIATRAGAAATGGPGTGGTADNATAIAAAPSIWRILAQGGLAAVFIAPAHFVRNPMGRAALQGAGLGVGVGLIKTLVEYFVIQKFFGKDSSGTATPFGQRYFPAEMAATDAVAALAAASSTTGTTGVGAGPRRNAMPFGTRGVGAPQVRGVGADQTMANCLPCSSETYAAAVAAANQSAQAAGCDPCGGGTDGGFPSNPPLQPPMPPGPPIPPGGIDPGPAPLPNPNPRGNPLAGVNGVARRKVGVFGAFPDE